jgi:hypothetical protein
VLENRWFKTRNTRSPHRIHPDEDGHFLFAPGTPEFAHVNAHVHATQTVRMVERLRGKPVPWKFGDPRRQQVAVHVNSGRTGSSHTKFGPRHIKLDTYTSPALGKEVKDAECAEAIAHEVGHDILQGLRPQHAEGDLETGAFAEAFGDCIAILYTMEYDKNRERALSQTGGDLRRQNLISKLFEEDGKAARLKENPNARQGFFIRSALNDSHYEPQTTEGYEEHKQSLPYTAAFYDVLVSAYERNCERGASPSQALLQARDSLGAVWARSLDYLPRKNIHFAHGMQALLRADQELGQGLSGLIRDSFQARGIV